MNGIQIVYGYESNPPMLQALAISMPSAASQLEAD